MQDLISRVHMKLGIRLESHMRDVDAATYCTAFFIQEALQSRKKCQRQANSAATQWRSMEAAKTKEVRTLLIINPMLRWFEEAEAVQILRSAAQNPEATGIAHPCCSMQATPNIREAWRSAAVASDFRHRWVHHLQMEEAETEVPFFVDRRSNDQVASWSANIETEDRSLRSDQAHARVPWSTRSAWQSFTWQEISPRGRREATSWTAQKHLSSRWQQQQRIVHARRGCSIVPNFISDSEAGLGTGGGRDDGRSN